MKIDWQGPDPSAAGTRMRAFVDLVIASASARRVDRHAEDGEGEDPVLDLSDEEMEGWRRWSCCGEPDTIGQAAGWLAHQMVAHSCISAWRPDDAPNPWWHPRPWQSDDQEPLDHNALRSKLGYYDSDLLIALCERHFYLPLIRRAKEIAFHREIEGAFERSAVWVVEVDRSLPCFQTGAFLVVVGAASFAYGRRTILRSVIGVASQHHVKGSAEAVAKKIIAEHGSTPTRALGFDYGDAG